MRPRTAGVRLREAGLLSEVRLLPEHYSDCSSVFSVTFAGEAPIDSLVWGSVRPRHGASFLEGPRPEAQNRAYLRFPHPTARESVFVF